MESGLKTARSHEIPAEEAEFHPLSYGDSNGRVFTWNGEIYRGIVPERAQFYRDFFESGQAGQLIDQGLLVESELTPYRLPDFPLVVRHRRLPFVTYPCEWSGEMLKRAALTLLDLKLELRRFNLATQDAHPWNILFDGHAPKFVDLGSIIPNTDDLPLYRDNGEFLRFAYYPLLGMEKGNARIVRRLLQDDVVGVNEEEVDVLISRANKSIRERGRQVLRKARKILPPAVHETMRRTLKGVDSNLSGRAPRVHEGADQYLRRLRDTIASIQIPQPETTWSGYYEEFPPFTPDASWNLKHRTVYDVLQRLRPKTVLDVGSNRGWFAQLAATMGSDVVAMDVDENCINRLYCDARDSDLPIQALYLDICAPTPGLGPSNKSFPPATERLQCELVMALAVTHHMTFGRNMRLDQTADALADFRSRYLLVEFVPKDDIYVSQWRPERFPWYTLDGFKKSLGRHFKKITTFPSNIEPRVLLLCER